MIDYGIGTAAGNPLFQRGAILVLGRAEDLSLLRVRRSSGTTSLIGRWRSLLSLRRDCIKIEPGDFSDRRANNATGDELKRPMGDCVLN